MSKNKHTKQSKKKRRRVFPLFDSIEHRYILLDRMYNSPEALLTRAAIDRMCATHNV